MNRDPFAYRLAPWRKQVKMILTTISVAAGIAAIAMVYLSISADMTDIKLQIQVLQQQRSDITQQIADQTTDEGMLTSYKSMQQRAQQAGFVDIDFDNEDIYSYVIVDGYTGTGINAIITQKQAEAITESLVKPEYSQSLQQWLAERIAVGIKSNENQY